MKRFQILLVLIIPTFLLGCERDPRAVQMERNREYYETQEAKAKARMAGLEGKQVFLDYTITSGHFHLRLDCPKVDLFKTDYRGAKPVQVKVEAEKATIRSGRVVDEKGFFHDRRTPCETCVP